MNLQETMKELEKLGTEQNRKTYKKHGAKEPLYGVSFANFAKLKKQIKKDHQLSMQLWNTKNSDARILATMIADPQQFDQKTALDWVNQTDWYMLTEYSLAELIAKTKYAKQIMEKLMKSNKENEKSCGYAILYQTLRNKINVTETDCKKYLKNIEKEIHTSPNRAKQAMNNAIISIGVWKLTKEAIETSRKIGKVTVDHGETNCKTPNAEEYIKKALRR